MSWVFFTLDGRIEMPEDWELDLSNAIEYPRGLFPALDEYIDELVETVEEATSAR